ncbi:caspase recruitment domain-containing protein 14 [Alosa sapidissima]|uniref:caspase recruitment domain-containing protein 14 n=1 Tax=Alosa sapidissima TaxID=34773 RepID=UPI001C093182|nr:caspase recruitment domain-containing protein 14 [Alosa sapidissima]XP_041961430.1 caspase recruitment domain-containing protein 14 [Alosa sapidissima]
MAVVDLDMDPELRDEEGDELWELINDNRHSVSLQVRPCIVIPYLRQARVLSEIDEDEIINCHQLKNFSMKTSHMLDLLRSRGLNGAVALLESLMIHYPTVYTRITGRKPSTEPSGFSGLIKYSELTEYLVRAVTSMQKELAETRQEADQLRERCAGLEAEAGGAAEHHEELRRLREESGRLRSHMASLHRDLLKVKDEKCELYGRYAAAVEEKSAVGLRCRDLNLQIYQLQCELRKAQTETDFQRRRSLRCVSPSETQQLREEISTLRRKLMEAETFSPAREDILAQDLVEAQDRRSELAEQLYRLREDNERLAREAEEMFEEKEALTLQVQKLALDCEMYQQKSTVFQSQLRELQAERDRAYLSRDDAQAQIARSLAEKDVLRSQLVELQEKVFNLRARSTERGPRDKSRTRQWSWESSYCGSSSEGAPPSPQPCSRLCRMNAIGPDLEVSDEGLSSIRSSHVEPPGSDSLRRRQFDLSLDNSLETEDSPFSLDTESDFVIINDSKSASLPTLPQKSRSLDTVSRASAPPFLMRSRPQAVRITGRQLTLTVQDGALLSQIQVVGGNKTGVFVHRVTEGSSAHTSGVSPGAQIIEVKYEEERQVLRMVLEDSTQEEALWALRQVKGPCQLSLRPNQDVYESLRQQLKKGEVTSGDSFYVRVNMSVPAGTAVGGLSIKCNDILHVTNTCHSTEGTWWASLVHPCQLQDLKSGSVPNYYRAQRLLIHSIEDMTFQHRAHKKVERVQGKQKAVRIVSTGRQPRNPLWVSVKKDGDGSTPRSCVTLMPYTLVTPHYPPVCRPVLLLPTVLGRVLHKRLAEMEGYQLCEPETLSASEHAVRVQKGEVLEECGDPSTHHCYTLQGVEKIMKRGTHCVLPLGLDCVRRLHRADIFPIIIFIAATKCSTSRLKHRLRHHSVSEAQLLDSSRAEEPLLDKLPCLYRMLQPECWREAALLDLIQGAVVEEQQKVVWVEPDLW